MKFIQGLTHISGASGGAISTSLIAIGMSPEDFTVLGKHLDIAKLLDADRFAVRASGNRLRNVLEIIYIQQIKAHIADIPEPTSEKEKLDFFIIKQKIKLYDDVLKQKNLVINNLKDVVDIIKDVAKLRVLDQAFKLLPKDLGTYGNKKIETPRITFRDLERLRSILPEDKKHLIKKLSVVTTNQTKGKLETFNADNSGADYSIAEKVQHSCAHPVLFVPARDSQGNSIADGGILDNMPVEVLLELGLNIEEILCVKIEADATFQDRIQKAQAHEPELMTELLRAVDSFVQVIIGGALLQQRTNIMNREKVLNHLGNMLYINSGTLTTTTTKPTEAQNEFAIANAYDATTELLKNRNKIFNRPLLAMLYLGLANLDELLILEGAEQEIINAAMQAKVIFLIQKALIDELNTDDFSSVEDHLQTIENTLQVNVGVTPLNEQQQKLAMAFCLKEIDYLTEGKLEKYIRDQIIMEDEQNRPRVGWFKQLLALLYRPIAWILSLCACTQPEEPVKEPSLKENGEQQKITPLKMLSMFAYKEPEIKPVKSVDRPKKECIRARWKCFAFTIELRP